MLRLVARIKYALDELVGAGRRFPPHAPALAVAASSSESSTNAPGNYGIQEMIEDMRILLGVPKYRTSKPKKITRKFSYTRLFTPVDNLLKCPKCGTQHEQGTICGNCYEKVRELTNRIKQQMMNYNPYKGDRNDKQVYIKFSDDNELQEGVLNNKRIVELDEPRPTWFKKIFQ